MDAFDAVFYIWKNILSCRSIPAAVISQIPSTFTSNKKAGHYKETSLHPKMSQTKSRDVYLVIGGNGFLGRHIVQQLLDRGDIVSVFDIVERYKDVSFYSGDITDRDSVASALRKVCLNIVYYLYIKNSPCTRVVQLVSSTRRHRLVL